MEAIKIDKLTKTYLSGDKKVEALKGVSFNIEKGEVFGLLGPNGAGKSTLISILGGSAKKTSGKAFVHGLDIDKKHSEVKRIIGIVPQEVSFDNFMTIAEALTLEFGYYGIKNNPKYLDEVLKKLSLEDKKHVIPRKLSGGMKRRFMIARALMHKPEVLILDEPTAGVDVELRLEMYDLIRQLNKQGTTIVLTTHYLEEVELLADRVGIIHHGKLVALDTKEQLKNRFQSTRQFSISLFQTIKSIPSILNKFSPQLKDDNLVLTFEETDYKEVLNLVSKADLPVAHFAIIEPSLEDVFVSLTNGDNK